MFLFTYHVAVYLDLSDGFCLHALFTHETMGHERRVLLWCVNLCVCVVTNPWGMSAVFSNQCSQATMQKSMVHLYYACLCRGMSLNWVSQVVKECCKKSYIMLTGFKT